MGIASSSATFTRFFVPEPVTEDFWSFVDEKLHAGCFKEGDDDQEQAVGFTAWDDFFDSTFTYGSYHKGEYVTFHFRLDQRKVAPIITKKYVHHGVQKYREEHEGTWPNRREKQEIMENVQSWLMGRALAHPSSCEVIWSPAARWMFVGTTSTKMLDAFLEHFERHFRVFPVPLYHVHWALNMLPLDTRKKDTLTSMVSIKSPTAMEEGRFLGFEFLTWLWFFTETSEKGIKFGEGGDQVAEVHLGERLVLALPGEGKERVICTTQANALHEARTALQQGKLVQEIQLFLRKGDNEYFLTLDSSLWPFKALKSPKQYSEFDKEDLDGRFLEKMYFLEESAAILDALYTRFLFERLDPGWELDTLPVLKQWIEGKLEEKSEEVKGEAADAAPF